MLNQAQIIGHLGKDPESRFLPSGEAVCNFSIATTEKWKDKASGEQKEQTEWHRINTFGRLAEVCGEYLRKGALVYVAGKITTRKYTDKDGVERYSTEITAREMKMLGGKGDAPTERQREATPAPAARQREATLSQQAVGGAASMSDDIPFLPLRGVAAMIA